ncbi:MAG: SAM-dependent methyltransferase [Xanthomonadaceae bacterium]|nr:SAM-dependent methyltransferase [Xanthomonadaceae bacterium]MDE1959565.1 SAM-dependent methyltransferase [Xanthomonadaceae bacterium]MDE2245189.1 SAM-dependent methyltransferase [Xanthomonadaceae bacterium]
MHLSLPDPDTDALAHSERLRTRLRERIAARGAMPFSEFMQQCLYAPGLGYYSAGAAKFGPAGDFITAPELGPLFARCIARVLAPLLPSLGVQAGILELGGGSGAFAADVLQALAELDALPARYRILEPSADLRERQRARIAALPAPLAARVDWIGGPPETPWHGVLFANEVIDALPATRFTLRHGEVCEEHVALGGDGRFLRTDRPADALVSAAVRHIERDLGEPFADGYRSELLPQLPYWMQAIAGTLEVGLMLFCDYGFPRREYYLPERRDGTLQAHYRHRAHADVLRWPGLQDLTASVDFTALAEAGNGAGFGVAGYLPQAQLLIASGLPQIFETAHAAAADENTRYRLAQEVKQLTLPGAMGERFQALLLARGLEAVAWPAELLLADQSRRL